MKDAVTEIIRSSLYYYSMFSLDENSSWRIVHDLKLFAQGLYLAGKYDVRKTNVVMFAEILEKDYTECYEELYGNGGKAFKLVNISRPVELFKVDEVILELVYICCNTKNMQERQLIEQFIAASFEVEKARREKLDWDISYYEPLPNDWIERLACIYEKFCHERKAEVQKRKLMIESRCSALKRDYSVAQGFFNDRRNENV